MSVVLADRFDIGVAVDAPAGLTVVVLRSADERQAADLAEELGALVERARAGRSRVEDLTGARFTITNLGGFGIDAFTPIVPAPQAAILGVGAYDRAAPDPRATLSLTFDHRVVDGAYAARFLARLADDLAGSTTTPRTDNEIG